MSSLRRLAYGYASILAFGLLACSCGSPSVPPNACTNNNGGCDVHALCSDDQGVAVCTCIPGYIGSGKANDCKKPDPCSAINNFGGCDPQATCTVSMDGLSAICTCPHEYIGDGYHCDLPPSCLTANGGCDANAKCTQTSNTAVDCACNEGYLGDGYTCVPIPKCSATSCNANATCDDSSGAIVCTCKPGFAGDGQTCTATTPCAINNGGCDKNAICSLDTMNHPVCACADFYTGDGHTCTAVPQCTMSNGGCDANATCTNPDTHSRVCACNPGWTGDGTSCMDVDECKAGTAHCDTNATCTNTPGSFSCACNSGFTGNGILCTDVNECQTGAAQCDPNAMCGNTIGSYTCMCDPGYSGDGKTCMAVDACATATCGSHQTCKPTGPGTSTCVCQTGYEPSLDGSTCVPINHCLDTPSPCDTNATCNYTGPGTYTCTCNSGWMGDGTTCSDVNECQQSPGPCSVNATCSNTPGSYTCTCGAGFTGNGTTCQSHYIQVAIGKRHMCAIRQDDLVHPTVDGSLYCWGWNNEGQFGNGTTNMYKPSQFPTLVSAPNGNKWVSVAAGKDDTCAIQTDGTLWCWGDNTTGQLGTGSTMAYQTAPQQVGIGIAWASVATEGNHTCAVTRGGDIYCWGLNNYGQLGTGDTGNTPVPKKVSGSSGQYTGVTTGASYTCAMQGTSIWCWGDNSTGQDAQPSTTPNELVPTQIVQPMMSPGGPLGNKPWLALSLDTGTATSCGIQSDGSLWCWGANTRGQVGDGTLNTDYAPMNVLDAMSSSQTWSAVAAGDQHTCAIQQGGAAACWGDNSSGQLGTGVYTPPYSQSPVAVLLPANTQGVSFKSITANDIYTCAIDTNTELWCWGQQSDPQAQIYTGIGTAPSLISQ